MKPNPSYPVPPLPSTRKGPPPALKQARAKVVAKLESEAAWDEPAPPPQRPKSDYAKRMDARVIPEAASLDFRLPQRSILIPNYRKLIRALVRSILRGEFMARIKETNFFTIRAQYRIGMFEEHVTIGEVYSHFYEGCDLEKVDVSNPHAWLILSNQSVWQFMIINPSCDSIKFPTWLEGVDRYMIFMHLRLDMPLPASIFDESEDTRGWAKFDDSKLPAPPSTYAGILTPDDDK